MKTEVKAIPEGFHTVTPCLTLKNSLEAIAFYKAAFGAKELGVFPSPDGKSTMHALIRIGDSFLMMGDEAPEPECRSAESLGASPIGLYVYVKDADAAFKQAVDAGAAVVMPIDDMFWGDRCGTVKDPFGYVWNIATHTRELSDKKVQEGAKAFFAKASTGNP
ncbi:MAG TPA: glyoxalase [Verrucomicrobia bacterium]|nr:MAG: glyoxalase [Lentisphaerae bacterium GWF2_57_35]HBA83363.1 glyoxalase [Verrucomicrobiota bacterium]